MELKRFDDYDYDRFVSLMGRRSAAQSDGESFRPIRAPKTSTPPNDPRLRLRLSVTDHRLDAGTRTSELDL